MKFTTIWDPTMPLPLRERLKRTRDWAAMEIGAHLPLRIRYWVTLQEIGKATMTSKNVPATPLDEILQKLDSPQVLS